MDNDAQDDAKYIVKRLVNFGFCAYFAGGWVRDYLMGLSSSDIDIATNAPPPIILDLFPNTTLVGLAFGVVIVTINGRMFEVSTFRKDIGHKDGRHPDSIELSTAQEDAKRRDFTINGMFYDPIENVIYDYVKGKEDLRAGVIRTIGDPHDRFVEDRLRMIRAIRFSARFGFVIDPETQQAMIENANKLFPAVAMERIWQEFNKMAQSPHFEMALLEMHRLGLLQVIFPQLEKIHLKEIKHTLSSFSHFPPKTPTILFLMELFPGASLEEKLEICHYLYASVRDQKLVEVMVKGTRFLEEECEIFLPEWVKFYANPHSQLCLNLVAARYSQEKRNAFLAKHHQQYERFLTHIRRIIEKKPLVTAALLQSKGILPSKQMGTLLKVAEELAIIRDLHDAEFVISLLKETESWPKKEMPCEK